MKRGTQCITVAVCLALMILVSGCGQKEQTKDLMEEINPTPVTANADLAGEGAAIATDFSVRLFQQSYEQDQNTLISPVSVLYALSMTANGAEGNTLVQMEEVLGMPVDDLNEYIYAYGENLASNDDCKVSIANSIWLKNDEELTVNQDFLQTNADYYGAGIYRAPFDKTTLKDINTWVSDNTDGMVKDILTEVPESAVMYLINTLAFDAQWEDIYSEYSIGEQIFTKEDGTEQTAEMMYSEERKYLEDENTTGFIKYYLYHDYAFVALLPDEGITMEEYVASLSGEKIAALMENAQYVPVNAGLPKFETEFDIKMSEALSDMGMTDAFDKTAADFSGIGQYQNDNLFIDEVFHKTYITVNDKGTKAGAATVVSVEAASEEGEMPEPKEVYLDRPFVYMIVDYKAEVPLFIGTVMDIGTE